MERLRLENEQLRRQLTETGDRGGADRGQARADAGARKSSADRELAGLREQLAAATRRAEAAESRLDQQRTRAQAAESRAGMAIMRAAIAENLLNRERELSGSGFVSVTMPQLDSDAAEGTVTSWLKEQGDHIQAGEPLLRVADGGGHTELRAPVPGIVCFIASSLAGKAVAPGTVLAVIDEARDRGAAQDSGRSVTVTMPQLGESSARGTVTRWLKREGDHIEADEPLLEVAKDYTDFEIPSPATGILRSIAVQEDETAAAGTQLAVIDATRSPWHEPSAPAPAPAKVVPQPTGKSVPVSMPQFGETLTAGTVTRWLKREGDHVEVDEPLGEVSTNNVDFELPSPAAGILRGITADEGETVAAGTQLAVIHETQAASHHHRVFAGPSPFWDDPAPADQVRRESRERGRDRNR